jgi:hypothetical protein
MSDEKVRVVADLLVKFDMAAGRDGVAESFASDILSKLSRLEQSRVERAVDVARKAHARYYQDSVECELFEEIIAILAAPTDSPAGSGGRLAPPFGTRRDDLAMHHWEKRSGVNGWTCSKCSLVAPPGPPSTAADCPVPSPRPSPTPAERRVAWRCPKHFKGNALLPVGGAAPCEDCGQWCWFGSGGPEWTTDPKPEPPPAELEPNSNIGGDPTPDDLLARAKRWAERADRTAPAGSELADVAGAIHCVVTYLQGHGTAEVKPSERIAELALLYEAEGLSGPAAIAKATCDYLDEQHARGRK